MSTTTYTLEIVCQKVGIGKDEIIKYVEKQIITPLDQANLIFDEEDLGRITLVQELKSHCDPNDESLQVILHLIDQIYSLQRNAPEDR